MRYVIRVILFVPEVCWLLEIFFSLKLFGSDVSFEPIEPLQPGEVIRDKLE